MWSIDLRCVHYIVRRIRQENSFIISSISDQGCNWRLVVQRLKSTPAVGEMLGLQFDVLYVATAANVADDRPKAIYMILFRDWPV